jgi:predicted small secreted protein
MIRLAVAVLMLSGLTLAGCTNTVRGLGKDVGSSTIQNYNRDEGDVRFDARTDMEMDADLGIDYDSRTATEMD